jgi:glutathione synthase/RimK-type ligase-like ATP-grasp enzyme
VEAELTEVIHGLYALLRHAYWLNDPFTTKLAHRKMLQLRVAADVGFSVPRTMVTNRAEDALSFARALPGDLAIKSLGALSVIEEGEQGAIQFGIFTRRIGLGELEAFSDKVAHMPTLFQEFVEKECEMRITCVGSRTFACRIEPRQGDLTSDDYRFDTKSLNHTAADCPELESPMQKYMRAFGLNFGCFDIAITPVGKPVFLECNPNGQWLWVENLTGLPIGKAVADDLLRHCAE